ncbi:hypothetical protein [Streptomyces albidoflavus]|uniref:hypothetical protein n=1 Tax=Streptomyces albidoflavus TaxID=1886 RepID=UPI001F5D615F|nr:hypothetical protein [Streptomyces albidoflavus]
MAAEQGQRLALVGEGVGGGAARVGGTGRLQGGGQVAGGRQVGGLGEQAGHGAVRDQFAAAVVGADDRAAQRGGVQAGRAVVGDHRVGGDQQGRPLLVRAGQDQARAQRRGHPAGEVETAGPAVGVGVQDQRDLVGVVGQEGEQFGGEPGAAGDE